MTIVNAGQITLKKFFELKQSPASTPTASSKKEKSPSKKPNASIVPKEEEKNVNENDCTKVKTNLFKFETSEPNISTK